MTNESRITYSQELNEQIKLLSKPNIFAFLYFIIADWLLIATSVYVAIQVSQWWCYLAAIAVIGNRQHAITVLMHDASHHSASRHHFLNDFFGNLLGAWPFFMSLSSYRIFHFEHHRDPCGKNDEELFHKKAFAPEWDLPKSRLMIFLYTLKDLIGLSARNMAYLGYLTRPRKPQQIIAPLLFQATVWSLLIMNFGFVVPALWFVSLVTTYWACFRWRIWFEHQGTKFTHRVHLNRLIRQIIAPHNIWVHYEHHNNASIPQHNLLKYRMLIEGPAIKSVTEMLNFFENTSPSKSGEIITD